MTSRSIRGEGVRLTKDEVVPVSTTMLKGFSGKIAGSRATRQASCQDVHQLHRHRLLHHRQLRGMLRVLNFLPRRCIGSVSFRGRPNGVGGGARPGLP